MLIAYKMFLISSRQHTVFMHAHHIVHLDIAPRNILSDLGGRYACIDYECSMRFEEFSEPRIRMIRCGEPPPEIERGEPGDPYKIDVFLLGMFMLRYMEVRFSY